MFWYPGISPALAKADDKQSLNSWAAKMGMGQTLWLPAMTWGANNCSVPHTRNLAIIDSHGQVWPFTNHKWFQYAITGLFLVICKLGCHPIHGLMSDFYVVFWAWKLWHVGAVWGKGSDFLCRPSRCGLCGQMLFFFIISHYTIYNKTSALSQCYVLNYLTLYFYSLFQSPSSINRGANGIHHHRAQHSFLDIFLHRVLDIGTRWCPPSYKLVYNPH